MFSIRSPGKTENLRWGRGHRTPALREQSAQGGPRCHWKINNDLFLRHDTSRKVCIYSRSNNMAHFSNCVWMSGKINMVSVMFPSELEICFIRHDPRENVCRENISPEGTETMVPSNFCLHPSSLPRTHSRYQPCFHSAPLATLTSGWTSISPWFQSTQAPNPFP